MDYSSAHASINAAESTQNAMKFPAWGGYAYKTTEGLTEQEVAAGEFRLVYVHRNGDQFVYRWDGVADYSYEGKLANDDGELAPLTGTPVAASTLEHDADLLEAYVSQEWQIGAQATFESRRTGSATW